MSEEEATANGSFNNASAPVGKGDANYYAALYQIVQDAQAAGSIVQIVTIWPPASIEGAPDVLHPMDCKPSGACPK